MAARRGFACMSTQAHEPSLVVAFLKSSLGETGNVRRLLVSQRLSLTVMPRPSLITSKKFSRGALESLRGAFRDGYSDLDAERVLGILSSATGISLAVLWAYRDSTGFGGHSECVALVNGVARRIVEDRDGVLAYLEGDGSEPRRIRILVGSVVNHSVSESRNLAAIQRGSFPS